MDAILWDGQKQIKGKLELRSSAIHFCMVDFVDTDLNLKFDYSKIKGVNYFKIFDLANNGVEIKTQNTRNVFIVEDSLRLKKSLEKIINKYRTSNHY